MGKRTDRSVIDVVPNGVAFNLAKSWLGLVKKDDEDDGNAILSRRENENLNNNNNNETFSLEAFRRESQREEEDCLLYTSPSPRDATLSRMPSSA